LVSVWAEHGRLTRSRGVVSPSMGCPQGRVAMSAKALLLMRPPRVDKPAELAPGISPSENGGPRLTR